MTDLARIQPAYVKTPTVQLLPDLLEELRTGALRIPPFQREFVWSQEQRLHLLDSVRRGLPTGSLMVWRTTRHLPHDPRLGPFRIDAPEASSFQYLLDGQQRLTTLFAALGAGLWTRRELSVPLQDGASTADDESAWQANFNLETEEFSVGDASPPEDGPALPLALILDDYAYDEWRAKQNLTRTHTNRAAALRAAFQSYPVAVVPLATDDITTVTLTFKRVNASGTPMSELHMARALSWNEGFDLTDHLDRVATALEPQGWGGLEREVILSVIAATSGLDPMSYDVEALAEKLRESTSVSDEDAGQPAPIDAATQALEQAIATFRELGFAGPSIVPSQRAVVLAAVALHEVLRDKRPLDEARRVMRSWLAQVLLGDQLGGAPPHTRRAMLRALRGDLGLAGGARRSRKAPPAAECMKFSLAWARSRVVAVALAAQRPLRPNGEALDAAQLLADKGTAGIPRLLDPDAPGVPAPMARALRAWTRGKTAQQHPANRVIAAPEEAEALRELILGGAPGDALLRSHLITERALQLLRQADFSGFLEERRRSIREAELAWARLHGVDEPVVKKGPSLSS